MAFNIMDMLRGIPNMLTQQGQGAPNMLANPGQSPMALPIGGSMQMPRADVDFLGRPQPEMVGTGRFAGEGALRGEIENPKGGGFMDKLQGFSRSPIGQNIQNAMLGWAQGGTMQDSLGKGAQMVAMGRKEREGDTERNQTLDFLRAKGMDDQTARAAMSNPAVLADVLKNMIQGQDPMAVLDLEKARLEVANLRNPTTDDIKEYQAAKAQGFGGTLQDWIVEGKKAGASSVNVTNGGGRFGTIPPGFELVEGPEGARLVPIPGGEPAAAAAAAEEANRARQQAEVSRGGLVTEEIDRAISTMDGGILPDTGFGAALAGIPGTDAKALSSRLETIKANIGFKELNDMRKQSPTGGALGQVTERELAFLQSVAGSLDQAQSAEDLKFNLNRLWDAYQDVIHGPGKGPARRSQNGGSAPATGGVVDYTDFFGAQ